MRSIRKKITVCLMATVLIALVLVGTSSITLNYRSTIATVDEMMSQTAVLAAERIEQELTAYKNVAMDTGCIPQLSDNEVPAEEKRAIIDERVRMHGFQRGNVIDITGISVFDGKDYSDREYVKQALAGNVYVSEPLISKITGELSIMVAAPIYFGGNQGARIVGVVYFVPPETFLNDIVSSIKVSEHSRAYMINKSGDTIADVTLETITTQNVERDAQSDKSLKELAAIHGEMRQGKNGFGSFKDTDGSRFTAYAPVDGTDGWSVAVTALQTDYLSDTYFGMFLNVAVIVASILASIVVAVKLSSNISVPMRACAERMKLLVEGDLDSPVPQATGQDETAELTRSTAEMVTGLNTIINDIGYLLTEMANQNFDIRSTHREAYVGEFQGILQSMRTLKLELSNTMRQIDSAASQVSSASNQVSTGAQTLSQGSMEQASAVEELAATITDISSNAKRTAAAAEEAGEVLASTGDPQLSDFVLDRAYYAEMLSAARDTGSGFLVRYVQASVDAANLRSAVRTLRMKKGADLLKRVLVEGGTVSPDSIQAAALSGSLEELFRPTQLRQAAELGTAAAQGGSLTAFEKACDDAVTAVAARAKSVPFGVEAVISYVAAKEIEFTAVRIIMSSRMAGIDGDTIRERLREAYV